MDSVTAVVIKLSLVFVLASVFSCVSARPQERQYGLRLQPELDIINVDEYLQSDKRMDLQLKCVLDLGPCDIVGRWVKPRVPFAFVGECPFCTPIQKANVMKILAYMQERRPEDYKKVIIKYLRNSGINVDSDVDPTTSSSSSTTTTVSTPSEGESITKV